VFSHLPGLCRRSSFMLLYTAICQRQLFSEIRKQIQPNHRKICRTWTRIMQLILVNLALSWLYFSLIYFEDELVFLVVISDEDAKQETNEVYWSIGAFSSNARQRCSNTSCKEAIKPAVLHHKAGYQRDCVSKHITQANIEISHLPLQK